MASLCLSTLSSLPSTSTASPVASASASMSSPLSLRHAGGGCSLALAPGISLLRPTTRARWRRGRREVVCMAPEEEKLTRRSPLDFPIEWERPKPGRRPDIFPQFSPMKTPLPTPLPADPPEEDEEEEEDEEKKEEEEEEKEEEDDPEKEKDPNKPEKL